MTAQRGPARAPTTTPGTLRHYRLRHSLSPAVGSPFLKRTLVQSDRPLPDVSLAWENDPSRIPSYVEFFTRNVLPEYISFSEMQDGRADSDCRWSLSLDAILHAQLLSAMTPQNPASSHRVAVARRGGDIVALALVEFYLDAVHPYAVLADLIVESAERGQGIGDRVVSWIVQACHERQCQRIFLESGSQNHRAHAFFAAHNFRPVSTVFVCDISPAQ